MYTSFEFYMVKKLIWGKFVMDIPVWVFRDINLLYYLKVSICTARDHLFLHYQEAHVWD